MNKRLYFHRTLRLLGYFFVGFLQIFLVMGISFGTRFSMGAAGFLPEMVGDLGYYLSNVWWMWLLYVFIMSYEGLYASRRLFWEEARDIIKYTFLWVVFLTMVLALTKQVGDFSRVVIFLMWLYGTVIFPFFHYLVKKLFIKLGIFNLNTLVVGAGNAGINAVKGFIKQPYLGYKVVGFCDDDPDKVKNGVSVFSKKFNVFGGLGKVEEIIKRYEIQNVVIAITSLPGNKLTDLANKIHNLVRRLIIIPNIRGVSLTNSEVNYLFEEELFLLKISNNLASRTNRFLKRLFDVTVSLLMLPVLAVVIAFIGILIKIDSPGPVFFIHGRIGRGCREIPVIKFRTMFKDAGKRLETLLNSDESVKNEWQSNFKLKNDPRITKVGSFLRRTSLDELPQIFNVLAGHMSLVGPRPVLKEELDKFYGKYCEYYYMVPPGITGLWQVGGRSNTDYDYRVWLDTWYILNWSLWMDVTIILKTIKVVLKGDGAY